MICVNVGSGQRRFGTRQHPWVNVDVQPRWNPEIVADAAHLPMFEDGTVDLVVAHHILEHYGCGDGEGMIREAHRILKPGGSFIVCVPDVWELSSMWREGHLSDQVYMTNMYGAYMNDEADRHKWGYTKKSLRLTLSVAFRQVRMFDWREIQGASIARDRWILAMEGIK